MFSLKISSFLKRINGVKMHIGLSPSKDDSGLEGNATSDRSEETTTAAKEEMNSKREAVDKLYKLEMDERGRSLSFSWALNSKQNVKHTPIGAPFKRARTNHLSSSTANYEPLQHPVGGKLKFIGDPSLQRRETPEPQRIHEANEEEALNSTSRRARSGRIPSRPKYTGEYRTRGRDTSMGREACSSKSGGFCEDDNSNQPNAELCDKPSSTTGRLHTNNMLPERGTANSEKVFSREDLAYDADSFFKQEVRSRQPSGAKIKPYRTFPSGAVVFCKNEPKQDPEDAALARESQDIIPQTKRKRSSHSTRYPEIGDGKPGIFKEVKTEVNTEEAEDWNFPSGARCILGLRPDSKDLILLEPVSSATRGQHITSAIHRGRSADEAEDKASLDRLMDIEQELLYFDGGKEERRDHRDTPNVESPTKVKFGTGASPEDANGDRLSHLETDYSSVKQTDITKYEIAICDTNLEVNTKCLAGAFLHCKDDLTNELKITGRTTTRVSDIHETWSCKTYSPNEESQIPLGVTEEDLIEAFIDHGILVSIRAADLVFKFRHHLKTVEANGAFLQLLKRYCKPEEKNGELHLEFRTC